MRMNRFDWLRKAMGLKISVPKKVRQLRQKAEMKVWESVTNGVILRMSIKAYTKGEARAAVKKSFGLKSTAGIKVLEVV